MKSTFTTATSADTKKRATFLFMGGAAQLNHHESRLRMVTPPH